MPDSPTRQLADEHEYVLLVVGAMEAEASHIERTGEVDVVRVTQMVDFTRNFTDGDHHTKEESLLFPLLEERSDAAGGTISVPPASTWPRATASARSTSADGCVDGRPVP